MGGLDHAFSPCGMGFRNRETGPSSFPEQGWKRPRHYPGTEDIASIWLQEAIQWQTAQLDFQAPSELGKPLLTELGLFSELCSGEERLEDVEAPFLFSSMPVPGRESRLSVRPSVRPLRGQSSCLCLHPVLCVDPPLPINRLG